jgi:hypothetical protein
MNEFEKEIGKVRLPDVCLSKGKEYFMDPITGKLIYKTPEEVVCQKIISFLVNKKNVPLNMIERSSFFKKNNKKDESSGIIIKWFSEEHNKFYPLTFIECKASGVRILDSMVKRCRYYAEKIGAYYMIITNGQEFIVEKYNKKRSAIIKLLDIPSYKKMLKEDADFSKVKIIKKRFLFDELRENQKYYTEYEFNENTPNRFLSFLTNLFECFMDVSHKMPCKKYKDFEVLNDCDLRWLRCGNPIGGYRGIFRTLEVKHRKIKKNINLSIFDYGTHTILAVSIEEENKKPHNALQYSIEENLIKEGDNFHFFHSGKITVGHLGAKKISELKAFISKKYPSLIVDDKIYLGTLKNKKLLYMNTPSVVKFVENCILYALARDEFREIVKRKAKLEEKN